MVVLSVLCSELFAVCGRSVCGVRVRVEHATGKVRPKPWNRGGMGGGGGGGGGGGRGPPPRRAFDPSDRCFTCNERGHYSYDCPRSGGGVRGGANRRRYCLLLYSMNNWRKHTV